MVDEGRGVEEVVEEFGDGSADDDLAEGEGGEDLEQGVFGEEADRSCGRIHWTVPPRRRWRG